MSELYCVMSVTVCNGVVLCEWLTDDLRGLVTVAGAASVREPCMFTYDVSMTQVVVVEADDTDQQFQSTWLIVKHLMNST